MNYEEVVKGGGLMCVWGREGLRWKILGAGRRSKGGTGQKGEGIEGGEGVL